MVHVLNRVLNYRPPPISDEEIYLTRRQRVTLSQLRSGHCKLLNSYKKRLKQTDSSSCPDCGMDPQDGPYLFNCTAHPTTVTPQSLWDRPVKTICCRYHCLTWWAGLGGGEGARGCGDVIQAVQIQSLALR